jgi:hypothetical protein
MKIPLGILAIVALLLLLLQWLAPAPGPEAMRARTDLPWQITRKPDGSSRVFGLDLGRATLDDAMAKFGGVESIAVFEPADGPLVMEAYFGDVQFGPLNAKVIVGLEAGADELAALRDRATGREGSPSGDWKYTLSDRPAVHAGRRLKLITYIPGTRNLDAEFFRSRFGEPSAWLTENERVATWFYPQLGLSITIDTGARDVLEYQPPADFVMPPGVTRNPAMNAP